MLGRAGANCQARGACAEEQGVGHAERCPPTMQAIRGGCLSLRGSMLRLLAPTHAPGTRWRVGLGRRERLQQGIHAVRVAVHGSQVEGGAAAAAVPRPHVCTLRAAWEQACMQRWAASACQRCRRLSVRTAQAVRGACEQHDRLWACTHVAAVLRLPTMPGESLHRSRKGQGGSPGQPAGGRQRCGRARRPA